jgi:hypothetical protein
VNNTPAAVIDPATLTKVTVNCTPRAIAALGRVTEATGDSKTDSINRAIQLYAELVTTEPGHGFAYEVKSGATRHVWVTETRPGRSTFTFRLFGWWRRRTT